jgi:HEAT repeat protein
MKSLFALFLPCVLLSSWLFSSSAAPPATDQTDDPDEQFLREAKLATDNASLIAFLIKRSDHDDDLLHLDRLIRQLGDPTPAKREEASQKLAAIGLAALPALRDALKNPDKEIARRAGTAIQEISKDTTWTLPSAAVRLLLRRQAPDTVEALLRYLPYVATDEATDEEIWFGVYELAKRDPRILPLLTPALKDRLPARRALAACVMGRLGDGGQQELVRKLLTDVDAVVRLRAAQGLLAGKDKTGIPTLIELLDQPDVPLAWQAEELLRYAAGTDAPETIVGAGGKETKSCRKAWDDWRQRHEAKLDLAAIDAEPRRPGLTLLAGGVRGTKGRIRLQVWLSGCDNATRWLWQEPEDMEAEEHVFQTLQCLPGGRFLVGLTSIIDADPAPTKRIGQLTERDSQGKILWQKDAKEHSSFEIYAGQRLPNGHTFWGTPRFLEETVPDGEPVFTLDWPTNRDSPLFDGRFVQKCPNGNLLTVRAGDRRLEEGWKVFECNPITGKTVKTKSWDKEFSDIRHVGLMPNGGYLVSGSRFDKDQREGVRAGTCQATCQGIIVREWKFEISGPAAVLPNGNLLRLGVVPGQRDPTSIQETDAAGRVLWETLSDARFYKIYPCLNLVRVGFDQPRPAGLDVVRSVEYQIKQLRSKKPELQQRAMSLLSAPGVKADAAIPVLMELTYSSNKDIAHSAAMTLISENIGMKVLKYVEALLKHTNPDVRRWATRIVSQHWPASKSFFLHVTNALKDTDPAVRLSAVWSLREIGQHSQEVVPHLISALQDRDSEVRRYSIYALEAVGSNSKEVVPAIIKLIKDEKDSVSLTAISVLATFAPNDKTVVTTLIEALKDRRTVYASCQALEKIGPAAEAAVPALKRLLNDEDVELRKTAGKTLEKIQLGRN